MRLALASTALIAGLGLASTAEAQCEKCPEGYTFWHSKGACLADDGSGAMTEPLFWKEDHAKAGASLYGQKIGGRSGGNAGPNGGQ
jgi:hypothetical protein